MTPVMHWTASPAGNSAIGSGMQGGTALPEGNPLSLGQCLVGVQELAESVFDGIPMG